MKTDRDGMRHLIQLSSLEMGRQSAMTYVSLRVSDLVAVLYRRCGVDPLKRRKSVYQPI
jgi:hypothetical protein